MSDALQFYFMSFLPYTELPPGHEKYDSLWVEYPNTNYDPVKGKALYERYLDEFVLADRLGFDGLVVNEHHSTVYSMMAAPNLIASALIQRTQNAKICIWGVPPNLEFPNRLAEEYAMLDVMSGGRIEVAFPLGTGMEYWSHPIRPVDARARNNESIEIILKAWTEPGPISHEGRFFTYKYLNVWPRPYQKPHPKLYIVGSGSPESMDFAARLGVGYAVAFTPQKRQIEINDEVRRLGKQYGNTIRNDQFPIGCMVYVADTDEEAEAEFKEHVRWFFENNLRTTARYLAPPGYMSVDKVRRSLQFQAQVHGAFDWDFMTANFRIGAGSPETIAKKIFKWSRETGAGVINFQAHLGNLPHWKTVKSLTLIANEVIPRVREMEAAERKKSKKRKRAA